MVDSVETQALNYAAELLGGYDALAQRMGVSPDVLQEWLQGRELPDDKLLAVLDIVLKAIDAESGR